ncbi:uncharacterized protein LOC143240307 isoform X3 [Tachypleus tridentatus]|uniref:uncharacterized protein LOC143240307 isoform X3 n=1 Tax=Tachypleus tridentatus TaxID=6853 RepID=UPI003FD28363
MSASTLLYVSKSLENRPDLKCGVCLKTFSRADVVRRHMLQHFVSPPKYGCDVCFKMFTRKDYLKYHRNRVCGKIIPKARLTERQR